MSAPIISWVIEENKRPKKPRNDKKNGRLEGEEANLDLNAAYQHHWMDRNSEERKEQENPLTCLDA